MKSVESRYLGHRFLPFLGYRVDFEGAFVQLVAALHFFSSFVSPLADLRGGGTSDAERIYIYLLD